MTVIAGIYSYTKDVGLTFLQHEKINRDGNID